MSNLAGFQRALDLYCAAVYWRSVGTAEGNEPDELAAELRDRAAAAGVSREQLVDAEQYARECVSKHRKPLMAGHSYSHFRNEAVR